MSIIRFRPNIVLRGGKPFDEDSWAEITIGEAGKFWLLTRSPRLVHTGPKLITQVPAPKCRCGNWYKG